MAAKNKLKLRLWVRPRRHPPSKFSPLNKNQLIPRAKRLRRRKAPANRKIRRRRLSQKTRRKRRIERMRRSVKKPKEGSLTNTWAHRVLKKYKNGSCKPKSTCRTIIKNSRAESRRQSQKQPAEVTPSPTSQLRTSKLMVTTHVTFSKFDSLCSLLCSEILDAKYILLRKLGWGHFSTVWLALKL